MLRLLNHFKNSALLIVLFGCLLPGMSVGEVKATVVNNDSVLAEMVNPGYHEKPAWFKESFLDLREDVAEASEDKKRVLLYFYQDGCPYCAKLLQDNLGQKIKELMEWPELRPRFGDEGFEYAKAWHNPQKVAGILKGIYEGL